MGGGKLIPPKFTYFHPGLTGSSPARNDARATTPPAATTVCAMTRPTRLHGGSVAGEVGDEKGARRGGSRPTPPSTDKKDTLHPPPNQTRAVGAHLNFHHL